ncbi:MAG: hypothetical protein NVSMB49_16770 [Ktedonobacteraceae bacterium]
MLIVKKRRVVRSTTLLKPAKRLVNKITTTTARRRAAEAEAKVEADRILQGAIGNGLKVLSPDEIAAMKANPRLARMVNEEAAVRAAATYGVDIRDAKGKIDMKMARKAAEAAAIQAAAEMGFDIRDKRGKINRRKAMEAARAAEAARKAKAAQAEGKSVATPVDPRVSAFLDRQDALLADVVRAAQQRGFSVDQFRIQELKSNPAQAGQVAVQAVMLAAVEAGVDIFKADGKIDMVKARQFAQDAAIKTAAEMGITDSSGKISRRKVLESARVADAARAGKPASDEVAASVSRQDALLIAALDEVERHGKPLLVPGKNISRREAYTDAELAAIVRRSLLEKLGKED